MATSSINVRPFVAAPGKWTDHQLECREIVQEPLNYEQILLLQQAVVAWTDHNFPDQPAYRPLLGIAEEVGELSHAHLKGEQGVRTDEDHEANAQDALGDMFVYMCHYAERRGWNLADCIRKAWCEVLERDWRKNKEKGVEKGDRETYPDPQVMIERLTGLSCSVLARDDQQFLEIVMKAYDENIDGFRLRQVYDKHRTSFGG